MKTRGITEPNMFVGPPYVYGGLVQILTRVWYAWLLVGLACSTNTDPFDREMAVGDTFGATALSSYGGFWIALAIMFTLGGFDIETERVKVDPEGSLGMVYVSHGLFLMVCLNFLVQMGRSSNVFCRDKDGSYSLPS